jgi:hypothetical protein
MDELHTDTPGNGTRSRHPYAWLVWAAAVLGVALLVIDHWAHVLGVLPYLVLLACPLMHFFMHRGHGHGGHGTKKE